ncbi:hypothetical protein RSAG8_03614, partial [Rhizoctonia solani AG-8 WAC10335]
MGLSSSTKLNRACPKGSKPREEKIDLSITGHMRKWNKALRPSTKFRLVLLSFGIGFSAEAIIFLGSIQAN